MVHKILVDGPVFCVARDLQGRILVGGRFSSVAGHSVKNLARLSVEGEIDPSFRFDVSGDVFALAVDPEGRIVVGGAFFAIDGFDSQFVARILPGGEVDTSFHAVPDDEIRCLTVQNDSRILIAGNFSHFYPDNLDQANIARLNVDGSADTSFRPQIRRMDVPNWPDPDVRSIAVGEDGRIYVGGVFAVVNGSARTNLACLKNSGDLDDSFAPNPDFSDPSDWPFGGIEALTVDQGGGLLVGGQFNRIGGLRRKNLARVLVSGDVDKEFDSDFSGPIYAISQIHDDAYVVAGGRIAVVRKSRQFLHLGSLPMPGTAFACLSLGRSKFVVAGAYSNGQNIAFLTTEGEIVRSDE